MVTGGRDMWDADLVQAVFDIPIIRANVRARTLLVKHGACPSGADLLVHWYCLGHDIEVQMFPADWDRHGKSAGPRRNGEMVASGCDIFLSFPGGRGTAHCTQLAVAAGLVVGAVSSGDGRQRDKGTESRGLIRFW
jgi:hypothetical protein